MVVEVAAVSAVSKVLAPFVKSIYDELSGKVKVAFEMWKSKSGAELVARYYHRLSQVKTIWARDDAVSIDDFYYPSRLVGHKDEKIITSIDDISCQYFVVQGIVGQGKSIFMRYLALSLFKKPKLKCLPIFVELRNINEKTSLFDLICVELGGLGLEPCLEVLNALANGDRIVLFIDGFDEAPADCISSLVREITGLQSDYPRLKIGVSSRPDNAIQNLPGFVILRLQYLGVSDYEPFLAGIGVETVKRHLLVNAIDESPKEIKDVMNTPLMLSMVVIIYETYKEIPAYLSEFFNSLFHVVFTKHDRKKLAFSRQHFSGLTESELQHAFEAFCFVVMNSGHGRTLDLVQFDESFRKSQSYAIVKKCTLEGFRKDIVDVACLMLEEGVGLTTFLHKGILDYFAAAFVRRTNANAVQRFYVKSADNFARWEHVLGFLSRIDDYRFSKFFELGPLKDECIRISGILSDRDLSRLLSYLDEGREKIVFTYRHNTNLSMHNYKKGALRYEIIFPLLIKIMNENPIKYSEFLARSGLDVSADTAESGNSQYGLKKAIEFAGHDFVWSRCALLSDELIARVQRAEKIVSDFEGSMDLIAIDFEGLNS
jgi:hypothetical protein